MADSSAAPAPIDWDRLYDAAHAVRERAHAPYSGFRVGAALLAADGTVFTGCNVENRSYGLTVCAERVAIQSAVAAGVHDYAAIAIVTAATPPAVPCGMCLETMTEFAPDLPILVADLAGERRLHTLRELHPNPFRFSAPRV